MNLIRFVCSILVLFLPFTSTGQSLVKVFGQTGVDEGGQTVIQSSDGNLFIGGYKSDSALIIKVDLLGNEIWSKTFLPVPGYINNISQLIITPDGYLIGAGTAARTTPYDLQGFYFKFDLNGNMIWCKRIVDITLFYCQRIMPVSSTQYILFLGDYDMSAVPYADVVTARIDASNGNLIWQSNRINYMSTPLEYIDDIGSATMGRNNVIYTTGRIYVSGGPATGMRPYVSKFDNAGNVQWSNYLLFNASQTARIYGMDIVYDNDSLIYAYTGDCIGASSNFTPGLIKTDTLGNVIWSKDYDLPGSSSEMVNNVVRLPNGYAMFGTTDLNGSATSRNLFIITTDLNGNMIWSKTYGSNVLGEYLRSGSTHMGLVVGNTIYFTAQQDDGVQKDVILFAADMNGDIICQPPIPFSPTITNNPTASVVCNMTFQFDTVNISNVTQTGNPVFPDLCSTYQLNLGNDTSLCTALALNATIAGATNYIWQDGSTQANYIATGPGIYYVTVYVNCCIVSDTIEIFQGTDALDVYFTPHAEGCGPLTVNFLDSTIINTGTITGWLWDFGDGNTSTLQNPTHTYLLPGNYIVTLTVTSSTGCVITTSTPNAVIVYPNPIAAFVITNLPLSSSDADANFLDQSVGAVTWQWDFGDNYMSTLQNPHHLYAGAGSYPVTLIVTNSYGCSDTAYYLLEVMDEYSFYIPNCFTPNGNGPNNTFTGIGLGITDFHMMIFDRWGMLFFESYDINKPWDGTFKGNLVQEDVYVYKIDVTDIFSVDHHYIGHVSVVR